MKLITWIALSPALLLAVVVAIANRQDVLVSLDPFNAADPVFAVRMPLFVVIFGAILAGIVLGGVADWFAQGRFRRKARQEHRQVKKLEKTIREKETAHVDAAADPIAAAASKAVTAKPPSG